MDSKLISHTQYWRYGYFRKLLDDIEIICYDSKIYVPQTLHRSVIYWYHFYLNHPGVSRLSKTIIKVFYWNN